MKNLSRRGFSLAELLLCLAIIGAVSAIGVNVAKIGTDSAYNKFYYAGYINLYNAIADAKASGINDTNGIIRHVNEVLKAQEDDDSEEAYIPGLKTFDIAYNEPSLKLLSYQALTTQSADVGGQYTTSGSANRRGYELQEKIDEDPIPCGPTGPIAPPVNPPGTFDPKTKDLVDQWGEKYEGELQGGEEIGNDGDDGDGNPNTPGPGNIAWPEIPNITDENGNLLKEDSDAAGNVHVIPTGNGIGFYYTDASVTGDYIGLVMTIPQRKTRANNGFAVVRLLYLNEDNGYLIPITEGSSVDLQSRGDLLPVYVDDGKIGRNTALSRDNGFEYQPIRYATFRDAFCTIRGNIGITGVISCNNATRVSNNTGVLKFADPNKVRGPVGRPEAVVANAGGGDNENNDNNSDDNNNNNNNSSNSNRHPLKDDIGDPLFPNDGDSGNNTGSGGSNGSGNNGGGSGNYRNGENDYKNPDSDNGGSGNAPHNELDWRQTIR